MLILYGSQTGTAQDVAENIWRESRRIGMSNSLIYGMDDYGIDQLLDKRLIIFVCSTTGQGDIPDNMKQFWRFLCRRNLPPDTLNHLFIAVLGLGDSSYENFNFAAKKLYRRLVQLGAKQLVPLGLADDQDHFGYDSVAQSWTKNLWERIRQTLGDTITEGSIQDGNRLGPKFCVIWTDTEQVGGFTNQRGKSTASTVDNPNPAISTYSQSTPFMATLVGNDRVTATDHFQETRLLTFSITDSGIFYLPGDVAYIQPVNLEESKEEFLIQLGHFDLDRPFTLSPNYPCFKRPTNSKFPWTLRECAESYFDIQSVPRRSFFSVLSYFAEEDSLEKEKLMEFCSVDGQEEYFSYCTRPRRTIVETMRDFPETVLRVPLDYWFDLIGPIRPRPFSIASCLDTHTDMIQILVAVVQYKTRLYGPRLGLCSNWLSRLPLHSKVPLWVQKGTIQFPSNDADPSPWCILIGPGTGVAPFRSFLHWRAMRGLKNVNVLFFGCRNERKDYYFRQEFQQMQENGTLKLFTAFSRDQPAPDGSKIYVQHRIRENGRLIAELLVKERAIVFVAGNAKQMPKDVLEALKEVLKEYFSGQGQYENGDEADLEACIDTYISKMKKEKRLQMETWS